MLAGTPPTAAVPAISPAASTYTTPIQVTLQDSTTGATIYYTTDGSYPTVYSTKYSGPISLSQNCSVRAVATAPGYSSSAALFAAYRFQTARPSIQPGTGSYTSLQTVSISDSTAGASIFYTTDGSTPTTSSSRYTGPFPLLPPATGTVTISAIAISSGRVSSDVAQSLLSFNLPPGDIAMADVNAAAVATISPSFIGFSHEWPDAQAMMGTSATGVNTIYRTLLKQILQNMQGPLSLRIGGGTTDTSGVPTAATVEPFKELASALNVDFILGVNLGSNNLSLAEGQAATYLSDLPEKLVTLEIGNEPDGYQWNGLRSPSYQYPEFLPQYQQWTSGITSTESSSVAFAGPVFGTGYWVESAQNDIKHSVLKANIVTQHKYIGCYNPKNPLPSNVLLQASWASPSLWQFEPYAAAVHSVNSKFRIDELNSVCSGGQPGVSDAFSAALWGIDTMFGYANAGIDGVNWHTGYQGAYYDLFHFAIWNNNGTNVFILKTVRPLFYGLLLFSQAAGNGADILGVTTMTDSNVKVWATKDTTGMAHVVVINKDQAATGKVQITFPGYTTGSAVTLTAPSYTATTGVTIGGQTFDGSPDGTLQGKATTQTITPNGDVWTVTVNPTSAVLLNLK